MKIFKRKEAVKSETNNNLDFKKERLRMVRKLINEGRISSPEVIRAMETVPRELFVLPRNMKIAYHDTPLSIGEGQTISAPHMVGIMVEALNLRKGQNVLEVGAGSGYHAAVVAQIVGSEGHVISIEIVPNLVDFASANLEKAKLDDIVDVIKGDGSLGFKKYAPYDRIFVACASPDIPPPLVRQLSDGGILLIPAGTGFYSDLIQCHKKGDKLIQKDLGGCAFVPMKGKYGF